MAATASDIEGWFASARKQQSSHMIVVCDTYDHDDYPVYCENETECWRKYDEHNGKNMQRIMEVYDISKGWKAQSSGLVMNLPAKRV